MGNHCYGFFALKSILWGSQPYENDYYVHTGSQLSSILQAEENEDNFESLANNMT